jgi:hypothetical protein
MSPLAAALGVYWWIWRFFLQAVAEGPAVTVTVVAGGQVDGGSGSVQSAPSMKTLGV